MTETRCACSCGKAQLTLTGRPLGRFRCHCTICQSVYKAPFADATILSMSGIKRDSIEHTEFSRHRLPPALQRGTCMSCGRPVMAHLFVAPYVRLAFIPAANYPKTYHLPEPAMHIFYDSRVSDIQDDLPKYNGYVSSELAVLRLVMRNVFAS